MKDRARSAERIVGVQKQLHRIEEVKYAQIQQKIVRAEMDQAELTAALSKDDALHGLFVDVTVRRLVSLRQEVARLGTKVGVEGRPIAILAPLVTLSKAEIIRLGLDLGLDYGLTTSCYAPDPAGRPCGACDSCRIRAAGFAAVNASDPRCDRIRRG